MTIRRALVSVSDKEGLIPLCQELHKRKVTIISTGGTAKILKEAGIPVVGIQDVTEFPEIMDGRVKTLHPKVHGGLLGLRDNDSHQKSAQELGIEWIDLVVVNLYPFEKTINKPEVALEDAIENIDIGGPSMLRSAAKNYRNVTVLSDPQDYDRFLEDLKTNNGNVSDDLKAQLALKVFSLTARYDGAISTFLQSRLCDEGAPQNLHLTLEKVQSLRYGENPHQAASLYTSAGTSNQGIAGARLLNGKPLSFNNLIDADGAWNLVQEFSNPACAVIKHTNPCGCALGENAPEAFERAWEGDPVSAFGSVIAFNRPIDVKTAESVVAGKKFVEVICAPDFSSQAVETLSSRKGWGGNLRLLSIDPSTNDCQQYRTISGGFLVQDQDLDLAEGFVSQTRDVTEKELEDLKFAWRVVKHVKSNAITVARGSQLLGAGAGQMNRVQSVTLALEQAGERARGAVLASDAFFPFRDSIDVAAKSGITAVIQPGGSKKDPEVIEACREHDIALVFTNMRHFRHG